MSCFLRHIIILIGIISSSVCNCSAQEETLVLRHVRQYVVTLQDGDTIVVIDGEVLNATSTPVSWIAIVATLYDEDGNAIESIRQMCGTVLDVKKLASMKYTEIVTRLSAYQHLHATPVIVTLQQTVPFMVVFSAAEMPHEFSVSAYVLDLGKE